MRAVLRSLTSRSPSGRKARPQGILSPVTAVGLAERLGRSGVPGPAAAALELGLGAAGLVAAFVGVGAALPVFPLEHPLTRTAPSVNAANRRITPSTVPDPGGINHQPTITR